MLSFGALKHTIAAALAGKPATDVDRAAGLPLGSVATMLRGNKVPSVERAGHILDALGLELWVRRKGEAIDPLALHLCVLQQFMLAPGSGGLKEAETVTTLVASSYEGWMKVFLRVSPDQRQAVFDLSQKALLDTGERLSARDQSGNADQVAAALAAATADSGGANQAADTTAGSSGVGQATDPTAGSED